MELPYSAAPGTVALRALEVDRTEDELGLSVTQETYELLVVLIDVTHADRCSCVATCTPALYSLEPLRRQAELRSSAGQHTLKRHALVNNADHHVELSSDVPQENPSRTMCYLL